MQGKRRTGAVDLKQYSCKRFAKVSAVLFLNLESALFSGTECFLTKAVACSCVTFPIGTV